MYPLSFRIYNKNSFVIHALQDDSSSSSMDDATLLDLVSQEQLDDLCRQCQLSTKGTKTTLLLRLRKHAQLQTEFERERRRNRVARVEEGSSDDSKERYEIVGNGAVEDDDEIIFMIPLSETTSNNTVSDKKPKRTKAPSITQSVVTAPPPPEHVNEQGERTVTIYSSSDQNDLTGVAMAQPGRSSFTGDTLTSNPGSSTRPQRWDMQQSKGKASTGEVETAKETVLELVQTLLAMTGAPAFQSLEDDELSAKIPAYAPPSTFVGFNPATVPTEFLMASSKALRTDRGHVLQEILRQFELQAIGQDGMAGDDKERGGGHYREVSKIRAFLEGYRRAEVRRMARETAAMLLDKLVAEGVEGLDLTLSSMMRSSDDTGDVPGSELNDSLLDYLNDAIRDQQIKVDQQAPLRNLEAQHISKEEEEIDRLASLWKVEIEGSERVETINPNDPAVKRVIQDEYLQSSASFEGRDIPRSAPEQLLLLLQLLRDRLKAEAAFGMDEKGRNLRLLAYCLRLSLDAEMEQLMIKDVGMSLDVSGRMCAMEFASGTMQTARLPASHHNRCRLGIYIHSALTRS